MLDRGIRKGLDNHGYERRRAASHRSGDGEQARLDLDRRTEQIEQGEDEVMVALGERGGLLAGNHALVDGDRGIGHRREMTRPRNDALIRLAVPTSRDESTTLSARSCTTGPSTRSIM